MLRLNNEKDQTVPVLQAEEGFVVYIDDLPPMPTPNITVKRKQRSAGVCLILLVIVFMVFFTITISSINKNNNSTNTSPSIIIAPIWCIALICTEALVALLSLYGVLYSDPGIVRRSNETCYPIPPELYEGLIAGTELPPVNLIAVTGEVYCVRCLVWRKELFYSSIGGEKLCCQKTNANNCYVRYHHCNTCGHCVRHFDHHCNLLGCCIAGRGLVGNFKYFVTLVLCGLAGLTTCGVAVYGAI